MRRHHWLAPSVILSTALLSACTDPAPGGAAGEEVGDTETRTIAPPGGVTVVSGAGWEKALQVSGELFEAAPAAVLAPAEDPAAIGIAAEEGAAARVPVLQTPPAGEGPSAPRAVAEELGRLGVEVVVSVAGAADSLGEGEWEVMDAGAEPGAVAARIPRIAAGPPPRETAVMVAGEEGVAAGATARAAGAWVLEVDPEAANPQESPEAIDFFHEHEPTAVLAIGNEFPDPELLEWQIRSAATGYELPGGGQGIFGPRQYVALYGTPGAPELGVLGQQDLDGAVDRVREVAQEYQDLTEKAVVPSFEIIATIASGQAGADGDYSTEVSPQKLRPWVERAGEEGIKVILDLQPGRTDFLTQAKEYSDLLKLPHVGLALDPEWRLEADQVHLRQIGSVTSAEINEVTTWLADLVNEEGLPPKMVVLHQFRTAMITDRDDLELSRPEVSVLIHADGQGGQDAKQETWRALHAGAPSALAWGWKNFLNEDSPVLTPAQTIEQVDPVPDLITYQ